MKKETFYKNCSSFGDRTVKGLSFDRYLKFLLSLTVAALLKGGKEKGEQPKDIKVVVIMSYSVAIELTAFEF